MSNCIYNIRIALFCLIQAIESDLRNIIIYNLINNNNLVSLLSSQQYEKISQRFKNDFPDVSPRDYTDLLVGYVDFGEAMEILIGNSAKMGKSISRNLRAWSSDIENLVAVRNRVMHIRPLLPTDYSSFINFIETKLLDSELIFSATSESLSQIYRDPSFLLEIKITPETDVSCICNNLPLPEFDDTGFIGRNEDQAALKKLIYSNQSVITLLGEGGIGKTALLVKVLYDIIDQQDCPFDYIVWTSSKTTVLTATGIQEIHNAISDFNSVINKINDVLGNSTTDIKSQIKEILLAVQSVKTLIVFDNLETIISSEILDFIYELQKFAQVIITSRIGLGELEYRRPIGPMTKSESGQLLRTLACIHNVSILSSLGNKKIEIYASELNHNPLAIKWFVFCVSTGESVETILLHKETLLDFCLSNVYDKISDKAKDVLKCFIAVRKPVSDSEICYYTNMDALEVRKTLNHLLATSFVDRYCASDSMECRYSLSSFAHQYLSTKIAVPIEYFNDIARKRKRLTVTTEQNKGLEYLNKFSVSFVDVCNNSEKIALAYLSPVLVMTRRCPLQESQVAEIDELLKKAKIITPNFYEVYRISAFAETCKPNPNLIFADNEYKKAVELSSNNSRVLYFYAGFLLKYFDDSEAALGILKNALISSPNSPDISIQHAKCLGYQGDLENAIIYLKKVIPISEKHKRIIASLSIEFYIRHNERLVKVDKDYQKALTNIHNGMNVFEQAVQDKYFDARIIEKARELFGGYEYFSELSEEEILAKNHYLSSYSKYFHSCARQENSKDVDKTNDKLVGNIIELHPSFAFIVVQSGERYYFNKELVAQEQNWNNLNNGLFVEFVLLKKNDKTYASNVKVISYDNNVDSED